MIKTIPAYVFPVEFEIAAHKEKYFLQFPSRIFFLILFLGFFWNILCAKNPVNSQIDSLYNRLNNAIDDTNKVDILYQLSKRAGWQVGNLDTALYFANTALHLSQKLNYQAGIASALHAIGIVHLQHGNYNEALVTITSSLKIRKEIGDKKGLILSYNNLGLTHQNMGLFPEAIKNYFFAIRISEQIGDKSGVAKGYGNIGYANQKLGNYNEALKNQLTALKIAQLIDDKPLVANCYLNLGHIYYSGLGNVLKALEYYKLTLAIMDQTADKNGKADCFLNIGSVYYAMGNENRDRKKQSDSLYFLAKENYFRSIELKQFVGDKYGIALAQNNIGMLYLKQGKVEEAKKRLLQSLALSKETGSKYRMLHNYLGLSEADSALGNFREGLEYYKLYVAYRDSVFNDENTKKIIQTEMQYDFDKKEAATKAEQEKKDAITLKEKQRQKLIRDGFIGGFATVLVFAGVFFTQRNKIKKGKLRSDELLLNILPTEVAEELKQNGSAVAKQFNEVTVMFTDFKNFTQIAERLSPVELVAEIHTCFKAFDGIMEKYGIEKIKTMGDSYMAAGGLPVPKTTNAVDVVNAALEIQGYMQNHIQQKMKEGKAVFEIRIGIHTGPVVAGIVGVKKFSYDIWGDTVNLASRMESSGEEGKVNISGSTYELVKDVFACTYRGKIEARNKGEVDMYFVEFKSIS